MKEHPVLVSEPIQNPWSNREKIAKVLFENLNVPGLLFAAQPILSLYSTSTYSGVVLESGDGVTQSCVVYEGYSLPASYCRFNYGGSTVTEYLQSLLKRSGYNFTTTSEYQIVKKIKEQFCISILSSREEAVKRSSDGGYVVCKLPDGTDLRLGDEKNLAPEILFNPSIHGMEYLAFHEMIAYSVNKVDIDLRANLYGSVLLTGGNTCIKALPEKTHAEIKKISKLKVVLHIPSNPQYTCWTGGNIISTLDAFKKMCVTKNEYSTEGNRCLHMKTI